MSDRHFNSSNTNNTKFTLDYPSENTFYEVVKHIFLYLNATKRMGLTYWRKPNNKWTYRINQIRLQCQMMVYYVNKFKLQQHNTLKIVGAYDTTWASDQVHRRSMEGIVMMLAAGAALCYRTS